VYILLTLVLKFTYAGCNKKTYLMISAISYIFVFYYKLFYNDYEKISLLNKI